MYELKDTIMSMTSIKYKERFKAEYWQTKIRYEKLKTLCNKIEAEEAYLKMHPRVKLIDRIKHDCPLDLLRGQQSAMGQYLHFLEVRAEIEDVELELM